MNFDSTNALAAFIDLMNLVFHKYVDEFVIVFVDSILFYSNDEELHKKHLRLTPEVLR